MQKYLPLILLVSVSASWTVGIDDGRAYHKEVGIPMAKQIKLREQLTSRNRRTVGGGPASLYYYPYVAGLIITLDSLDLSICTASLLSHQHLVSAAHCWYDGTDQAEYYTVVLGSEKLYKGGLRIDTSKVVVHPEWKPATLLNDIAIIYLPRRILFSHKISPVALPRGTDLSKTFVGHWAEVIGFGRTRDGYESFSGRIITQVKVKVISNSMCGESYNEYKPRSQICTSGSGGVGICAGDSGGPLIIKKNRRHVLIGISSYSDSLSCVRGIPSGYTRVAEFYDFIHKHVY